MKKLSRKEKLLYTTGASFGFQLVSIISGFILPRLILKTFGSDVNGLVTSIIHYLSIISLLDLGVGEVVRSALYKPLAQRDYVQVSKVIVSGEKYFRRVATILIAYIAIVIVLFNFIIENSFGGIYTTTLIISISISSFAQYYYGIVNGILLTADQKGYILYYLQIFTVILNIIITTILMLSGQSIQIVRLSTSIVFLFRPLLLNMYVKKNYPINRKIKNAGEPIQQKWNGMAQHISTVVLNHIDTVILSLFASMSEVSVYSVYHYVVYGVKNLFDAMTTGIKPLLGELWVNKMEGSGDLINTFNYVEWVIHTLTVFVYGCTIMLILPFITIYTKGVNDANYILPSFGIILVMAYAVYSIRLPYNMMILAAGHFKQTQKYYIIATMINIVTSILFVFKWGIVGVAIGTLLAMIFHTIWTVLYNTKYILRRPIKIFLKQLFVNIVTMCIGIFITQAIRLKNTNYLSWFFMALKVSILWIATSCIINLMFYRRYFIGIIKKIKKS